MYAQSYSNLRRNKIIFLDSVLLDSLSIVPESEIVRSLNGEVIADSLYHINFSKSIIYCKHPSIINQEILISYRVFPYNFSKPYPSISLKNNNSQPQPILSYNNRLNPIANSENSGSELQVNGNISRGLSMGNSQNAVVNSNLNLQLSGKLSDDLYIEALLSDKNIPVQPDGYTQQIQEFDQVYIRVYDSVRSLQMGDVQISATNSNFLQFNRKILGGNFTNQQIKFTEHTNAQTQVSAAVSKGTYNRTQISGIEGIQGPYPLKGANNESYIVILAGTERVYLDGILMQRGENADYVINYNTAELSFTPLHFITKDSRIIAEFEYSDKNYNRFLFYTNNQVNHKKGSYSIQYYTEGDAKNQPVNQQLTDEYKQVLGNAGNDPFKAIVPNFDSIGYDKNLILYKLIDTTANGYYFDSVLVYSINPDSAFYQAGFAIVGENRGNYIQVITPANGKVFKWLAPVNNVPQGNYEPVQILIAPQKQQMLVAKTEIAINARTHALVEMALSQKDANTFSDINNDNNQGWALRNFVEHILPLHQHKFSMSLNYELAQKNFSPIERYKNAEFNRDWNLFMPIYNDEHLLQANIKLYDNKKTEASLLSEYLNYGSTYQGFRNSVVTKLTFYKFTFAGKGSLLNSEDLTNKTQFYRHNFSLIRPLWKIKLGLRHDFEDNKLSNIITDSLSLQSQKYSAAEAFISSGDSATNTFLLSYKNRVDFYPLKNTLTPSTETNDIAFSSQLGAGKKQSLKTTIIWRDLELKTDNPLISSKNEQNLLARVDHQLKLKKNVISFFTFYEIGSGLETKKEFSFLEVALGQGIYVWVDYNNNNIPELNEFEVSPFPEEANYIKFYTPTNDYIKVYDLKFNETIKLDPAQLWRNEEGLKKMLTRFQNTFTFRAEQKHTQNDLLSRINPFPGYVDDTSQMNRNISFRNTFSFNRTHPKFGADYSYSLQNQKNLMLNGFDASENLMHQLKLRWNISSDLLLLNNSDIQSNTFTSEYFTEKNYLVKTLGNKISVQWQPTTKFRLLLMYQIKSKTNQWGNETAQLQEAGPEIKLNSPKQGMVSANFSIILNDYVGETDAPIAYTMLEGFQPGENYRWAVNFSRNLNQFLRINLSYTGRKPADNPIIHTGQFSVSAYF